MMSVREAVKVLRSDNIESLTENIEAMEVVISTVEKIIDLVDKEEGKDE